MTKRPSVLDYKKYGAQLDKNLVDMAFKAPGDYKPAEGLIDDLSQVNKKPLSTGEAIFEGGLAGLKAGLKKADQYKTMRVLEWFQQNAMAAKQQNDWHMQREQFLESSTPYAEGLYSIANSKMDEATKQQYIADLMKQYQGVNPEAAKYDIVSAPAGQDFFIQEDRSTGEKKITPYSTVMTGDAWQGVQKRDLENLKLGILQQNAGVSAANSAAYIKDVNKRWDPQSQGEVAEMKKRAAQNAAQAKDEQAELYKIDTHLPELRNTEKVILESNLAGSGSLTEFKRKIARTIGADYDETTAKLNMGPFVSRWHDIMKGVLTDDDRTFLLEIDVNFANNKQATLEKLGQIIKKTENRRNQLSSNLDKYHKDPTANLNHNLQPLTENEYTRMRTPEGLVKYIPNNQVEQAILNNYIDLDNQPQSDKPQQTPQGNPSIQDRRQQLLLRKQELSNGR